MVEFNKVEGAEALSPLAGLRASAHPNPAVRLQETWPFTATQIALWPETSAAKQTKIAKALGVKTIPASPTQGFELAKDGASILPLMPHRVLRVADAPLADKLVSDLRAADASLLDLSQARVLLTLSGADWRWVLMKGGSLDFESLAVGSVAQSPLFKVSCLIWVTGEDEVTILAPYSFARAVAEKILDAASDVGCGF